MLLQRIEPPLGVGRDCTPQALTASMTYMLTGSSQGAGLGAPQPQNVEFRTVVPWMLDVLADWRHSQGKSCSSTRTSPAAMHRVTLASATDSLPYLSHICG